MSAIYVEVTKARGSVPRDAGTAMKVTPSSTEGTIGGGALEFQAIRTARDILGRGGADAVQTVPLGPNLGQCCGGAVTLRYTRTPRPVDQPGHRAHFRAQRDANRPPLWIWGAGHVGRAVVRACPQAAFAITWVDSGADRFPASLDDRIDAIPTRDMPKLAAHAPCTAHHLIFTYSHEIDFSLCAALLTRGFASCGLIGSDTKWTRFQKRLSAAGHDPAPITCPIGDKSLANT